MGPIDRSETSLIEYRPMPCNMEGFGNAYLRRTVCGLDVRTETK
jgi:hypothetical protein